MACFGFEYSLVYLNFIVRRELEIEVIRTFIKASVSDFLKSIVILKELT